MGLCGKDGNLVTARPQAADMGVGFVGEVTHVKPEIVKSLVEAGYIPVISSVAADETGQAYNINAGRFPVPDLELAGGAKNEMPPEKDLID